MSVQINFLCIDQSNCGQKIEFVNNQNSLKTQHWVIAGTKV